MNEIQRLIHEMCPDGVPMVALGEVLNFEQPTKYIVKSTEYNNCFPIPVLTAGQSFILGYTNETEGIYEASKDKPTIIFDDFTTSSHWVDFCFKVKSSAMKMLRPSNDNNCFRYIFYAMRCIDYVPIEHARHWIGKYSLFQIPLPPLPIQQRIVEILDKFTSLVSSLDSEIALRQKQYEFYRNKLLSFEEGEEGVEWKKLIDIVSEDCSVSYGIVQPGDDTPNGIPVVRPVDMTDNIVFNKGLKRTQKENSDAYSRTILKGGEILVCVRGTTGIVSIASQGLKGCNVTRGIVPLSFKNDIETKFVFHTFKTHFIQDAIENKTNGTGLRQINIKDLKEILFPIPPLDRQLSIVRTLDTFESLLTNLKKERELRQKQYEYYREKLLTFA